ncbi:PR domain zinc finger protein 10-like [Uranotaenia lowii]|uniref:PR domain zinc finger protein 10-like n=1 Tax=Uranotaenia lowii TaxID=190385 RepID=UPI0024783673|nr:PR domain zinc finger protein 10-like [Uranotaenia lowii]
MDKFCRTCSVTLDSAIGHTCVFNFISTGDTIAGYIQTICAIQISEADFFSKELCYQCLNELLTAVNFRRKCELADQNFRQMCETQQDMSANDTHTEVLDQRINSRLTTPRMPNVDQVVESENDAIENVSTPDDVFEYIIEDEDEDEMLQTDTQFDEPEGSGSRYHMIEMMSFRCCRCTGLFFSQEERQQHIESGHGIVCPVIDSLLESELSCFICDEHFEKVEELKVHQGKSFVELYQCSSCDNFYEQQVDVESHFNSVHIEGSTEMLEANESSIAKNDSGKRTSRKQNRESKSKKQKTERFCCVTHCHEVFQNEEQLIAHAKENHLLDGPLIRAMVTHR